METDYSEVPSITQEEEKEAGKGAEVGGTHDWRDYNGVNYVSPVKDQGTCGASVAFTNIAAAESKFKIDNEAGKFSRSWPSISDGFLSFSEQ